MTSECERIICVQHDYLWVEQAMSFNAMTRISGLVIAYTLLN